MKRYDRFFLSAIVFFYFPYLSQALTLPHQSDLSILVKAPPRPLYIADNPSNARFAEQIEQETLWRKVMRREAMVQRAWITSMVLPGLGQMYNKDYWKVPCLYLGFALVGYKIYSEHEEMHKHKRVLLLDENATSRLNDDQNKPNPLYTNTRIRECERARNLFIMIASAWYLLNILDAYAGAHEQTVNFIDDIGTTSTPLSQNNHLK